jgi:uncharacterized membrane protein
MTHLSASSLTSIHVIMAVSLPASAADVARMHLLEGVNAYPRAVSSAGETAVGSIGNGPHRAVRWTAKATPLEYPNSPLFASGSIASAVSSDGSVAVGGMFGSAGSSAAAMWDQIGVQTLWSGGVAHAVDATGRTVVGNRDIDPGAPFINRAVRWTVANGPQDLHVPLGFENSEVSDVSDSGLVIVGNVYNEGTPRQPVLWGPGDTITLLPSIEGASDLRAQCVSGNGLVVALMVRRAGDFSCVLWDAINGYREIVTTHRFQPSAISFDGSVVVGDNGGSNVYRWELTSGIRPLLNDLAESGADTSGWSSLSDATGLSRDGRWIAGRGIYRGQSSGFLAFSPLECIGDLFPNGTINGADLGIMLSEWGPAVGNTISDLNRDGSVDGADLGYLLANWGPCPN